MLKHENLFIKIYNTFKADKIYLDGYLPDQIYYQLEDNLSKNYIENKKHVLKEYSIFLKKNANNNSEDILKEKNIIENANKDKINDGVSDEDNTEKIDIDLNSNVEKNMNEYSAKENHNSLDNEDENHVDKDNSEQNADHSYNTNTNSSDENNFSETNSEEKNLESENSIFDEDNSIEQEHCESDSTEYSMYDSDSDSSLDKLLTLPATKTLKILNSKIDKNLKKK